jgi:GDP-L-fucose synthase
MTILVTGSGGLIGNALQRVGSSEDAFFADRSHADLTRGDEVEDLFSRVRPSRVIHLAARVGGIGGNINAAGQFFYENSLINVNVLETARRSKVEKLVSLMSTCIFPHDATYPLTPEQLHLGEPHPSNFGYAYAKRMLDVQNRAYQAQWGLKYFSAIPTNVYGPCDNFSLNEGHVVGSLIHKAFKSKANGTPLYVWGSGRPLREFVYVDDVAHILLSLIKDYDGVSPVIITNAHETSIRTLVDVIVQSLGFTGEIEFDSTKPDGQFRKPSSRSVLNSMLPKYSFTKLQTGIRETVAWFEQNYPQVRL